MTNGEALKYLQKEYACRNVTEEDCNVLSSGDPCGECENYVDEDCLTEAIQVAIEALKTKSKQLEILADVLDDCPLTHPCDKLWKPEGWCEKHCKDGQAEPDKECWLKYAEVMAKCTE